VSRLTRLQARRAALLVRCAEQRRELAHSFAELRPQMLRPMMPSAAGAGGAAARAARHPIAWLVVLAGLTFLGRTREVLQLLVFMRSAVSLATRAAQLLRSLGSARAARARPAATAAAVGAPSEPGSA
jgi:hypothetical protein